MILRIAERTSAWVQIDRRALRDARLSFKARGLLAYLLSMPDNWTANTDHLSAQGPDGRTAILSALKELEDVGYLVRTRHRGDDGKFNWESLLHEWPPQSGFPTTDNPSVDNPRSDNPTSKLEVKKVDLESEASPGGEIATVTSLVDRVLNEQMQTLVDRRSWNLLEEVFLPAWDRVQAEGKRGDAIALVVRYVETVLNEPIDDQTRTFIAMSVTEHGKVALQAWALTLGATAEDTPRARLAYARAVMRRTVDEMKSA